MRIGRYEVPAEVEQICLDRMKRVELGWFRKDNIAAIAGAKMAFVGGDMCGGDCDDCSLCDKIADRLIQRERMARRIRIVQYPWWEYVGK